MPSYLVYIPISIVGKDFPHVEGVTIALEIEAPSSKEVTLIVHKSLQTLVNSHLDVNANVARLIRWCIVQSTLRGDDLVNHVFAQLSTIPAVKVPDDLQEALRLFHTLPEQWDVVEKMVADLG